MSHTATPPPQDQRPLLDRWVARLFDDHGSKGLGSGWASGTIGVALGVAGVLGVLCLQLPGLLTWPQLRTVYALWWVRPLLEGSIAAAFLLGLLSALLRERRVLGLTAMGLALGASLLGGANVEFSGYGNASWSLGLDWFVLNLLLLAVVFIPLERLFPHAPEQSVFRRGWTTDVVHFFVSHLLVQASTLLTLAPAAALGAWLVWPPLQAWIAALPGVVQFLMIVFVADLGEYIAHRAFHTIPALWPFHAVHHSSEEVDWLAGSRLHLVDVVLTRGFTFIPIHLLGFAQGPVYAYLVFVSFHAVFIHANLRWSFGPLERFVVTPRYHHWHHSAQEEALDKNFAVHLPWIDRLFGTHHLPRDRWPDQYGLHGEQMPEGWWSQVTWPFRRRR